MSRENQDIETLERNFTKLKQDLVALSEAVSTAGSDGVTVLKDRLNGLLASADAYSEILIGEGRDAAARVGSAVRERPLIMVLAAFGLGFIGSRMLEKR